MKNSIKIVLFFAIMTTMSLTSCIENEPALWEGSLVEFDATVLNAPALGKDFPLLTRVPAYGFPVAAANPTITRASGAINFRINFVSAHRSSDETIELRVVPEETTAVEGVHYTVPTTVVIPANSSYADLTITVINPGVSSGTPVNLVLELVGNGTIQPSANYKRMGIRISQT